MKTNPSGGTLSCRQLCTLVLAFSFPAVAASQTCDPQPFGTVTLTPAWNIDGSGDNVDSIAFWHPYSDPDSTLMFVTAKDNSLVEIWRYPFEGNELSALTHPSFGTANVNGVSVDQANDRLYVSVGDPENTVSVFTLPDLVFAFEFGKPGAGYGIEPNLAHVKLTGGGLRMLVSSADSVYVHDAVDGGYIDEWMPAVGLETMAADSFYQAIYIPDENGGTGVYAYEIDGSSFERQGTNVFGATNFDADAEGIIVVTCPLHGPGDDGSGLIVVSDQLAAGTELEFFDRSDWSHLGILKLVGVTNTDGIASTQRPMTNFPDGILAALDNDSSVAGIGWDAVFAATTVLPVELSDFRATVDGDLVILTWRTESEVGNAGFEIQRRNKSASFTTIHFVPGRGAANEPVNYKHVVRNLVPGTHVFRIRQVDIDGSSKTSESVEVFVGPESGLYVSAAFPNPFRESTVLTLTSSIEQHVKAALHDSLGRRVRLLLDAQMRPGETRRISLNSGELAAGQYLITVRGKTRVETRHVVIAR